MTNAEYRTFRDSPMYEPRSLDHDFQTNSRAPLGFTPHSSGTTSTLAIVYDHPEIENFREPLAAVANQLLRDVTKSGGATQ